MHDEEQITPSCLPSSLVVGYSSRRSAGHPLAYESANDFMSGGRATIQPGLESIRHICSELADIAGPVGGGVHILVFQASSCMCIGCAGAWGKTELAFVHWAGASSCFREDAA
eukprot:3909264-Rhodomonas_salina.1